jgi:hypothetical protein
LRNLSIDYNVNFKHFFTELLPLKNHLLWKRHGVGKPKALREGTEKSVIDNKSGSRVGGEKEKEGGSRGRGEGEGVISDWSLIEEKSRTIPVRVRRA